MIRELGQAPGLELVAVDGPNIRFLGAEMHTRMVVARLPGNRLWVHSPIDLAAAQPFLDTFGGEPAFLVAPNHFHHLYVEQWQARYPEAKLFVEPKLAAKKLNLAGEVLTDDPPAEYAEWFDQLIADSHAAFQEAVFFHKASRTLILTDLMINLPVDHVPLLPRMFLRFEQVVWPNGGIPRLYRLTANRAKARKIAETILAWEPKQISLCHGAPPEGDATEVMRKQFAWVLDR